VITRKEYERYSLEKWKRAVVRTRRIIRNNGGGVILARVEVTIKDKWRGFKIEADGISIGRVQPYDLDFVRWKDAEEP
jgi:hypothetical protein